MSGVIEERQAKKILMLEWHSGEVQGSLRRSLNIDQPTWLAHSCAFTEEVNGLGNVLNDVVTHHEVELVIGKRNRFSIQIRFPEYVTFRFIVTYVRVINAKMVQTCEAQLLSLANLAKPEASYVEYITVRLRL
jgi:hypothetical protein